MEAEQTNQPKGGRAILLGLEQAVADLLDADLGVHMDLRYLRSPEQLFVSMERSGLQADAMVLGVGLENPVRVVQRIHAQGADIPILIMTDPARHEQLTQALRFAPFIGSDVKSWRSDSLESLPQVLSQAVQRAQKRRQFKGSIAEAQRRLGAIPSGRPQVSHYFDRLLDHAPIGVLNVDVQGTILSLNRYACNVLGTSERAALGTLFACYFPESESVRLRDIIARCVAPMRKRVPEIFEICLRDDLVRHVEIVASSLVDRTGQLGAAVILQDVTDRVRAEGKRRKAEESLRTSEARYRELIQTMNEALAMTDQDYQITFVNQSFCDMFGYSVDQAVGRPLLDLVHPDDVDTMVGRMRERDVCQPQRFEATWVARDGRVIHTLTSPRTFHDRDGGFAGCLGVFTDITDRKRVEEELRNSEAQLRLVTDAIPVLILYLDGDRRLRFFNRAVGDWFEVKRETSIGVHLSELIGTSAYEHMRPSIDAALHGQTVECEQSLNFRDLAVREVRCALVPDLNDGGAVRGLVVVISDITESKRIEQWERAHLQELAHVSRVTTIGQMSSQIAHELAQPLTAISGMSSALLMLFNGDAATKEDIRDGLTEISEQSKRAREIVIRLRNFVRKNEMRHVPLEINDLIRTVLRLADPRTQHRGLETVVELAEGLPPIMGDQILLEQVLLNLVRNAIEAMDGTQSKPHRLTIRSAMRGEGQLEVSISDTGLGLSSDLIDKVFEPFFSTKTDGMGMGLVITRSVVEAHGGQLRAECNPGGGAIFSFVLPLVTGAGHTS